MYFLNHKLLLGSQSPRRQEILSQSGFVFDLVPIAYEEKVGSNENIPVLELPMYFASQKALHGKRYIRDAEVLLTADTLVFIDEKVLGKPANREEAFGMLEALSGKKHTVITGVCLHSKEKKVVFEDHTDVYLKMFDHKEIEYYLDNYRPLDKAGAYGVQDWIGMVGIEKIEGSFYNVMGLPIHKVYEHLKAFSETGDFIYKPWKT